MVKASMAKRLWRVVCKKITVKEFQNLQALQNNITEIELRFKYDSYKYHLGIKLYDTPPGSTCIDLFPKEGPYKKFRELSDILEAYYQTQPLRSSFDPGGDYMLFIIRKRLPFERLEEDIRDFFMTRFKDVKIAEVTIQNITDADLKLLRLPKTKIKVYPLKK